MRVSDGVQVLQVGQLPAPQGSKRHVGGGRMVESSAKHLKPYREALVFAARHAMSGREPLDGALKFSAAVYLPRRKSHYGTGANSDVLKPSAPVWPFPYQRGDFDKIQRAIGDAMTMAQVWHDDAQVVDGRIVLGFVPVTAEPMTLVIVRPMRSVMFSGSRPHRDRPLGQGGQDVGGDGPASDGARASPRADEHPGPLPLHVFNETGDHRDK